MKKDTKPFQKTVGMKELLAFEPGNEATYTGIPVVDAVFEAFYTLYPAGAAEVAAYLELPDRKLSAAMEVCTGLQLRDIAEIMRAVHLRKALLRHLDWPFEAIAAEAGLANRSAAHHLMKNKKYAQFFCDIDLKELRRRRYYDGQKDAESPAR